MTTTPRTQSHADLLPDPDHLPDPGPLAGADQPSAPPDRSAGRVQPTLAVERVSDRAQLLAAAGADVYVQSSLPRAEALTAWRAGSGIAWLTRSRRRQGAGWLTVVAEPTAAAALVQAAVEDGSPGDIAGATVPAAALPLLPAALRSTAYNLWDWFWTDTAPPVQPGEERVRWAAASDDAAIAALLDGHSPRHSARPGEPEVLRWCVLPADADAGADGGFLACAAQVEYVPGVPHLASIVTRTDLRGRGVGRAITAWITRQIMAEGAGTVTLGMYADNEPARRVYHRLGYTDSHHWASGYLPGRRPAA